MSAVALVFVALPAFAVPSGVTGRSAPAVLRALGVGRVRAATLFENPIIALDGATPATGMMSGTLDSVTNPNDVGYFSLRAGETVRITANDPALGLELYDDSVTSLTATDVDTADPGNSPVARLSAGALTYTATQSGDFDLRVVGNGFGGTYAASVDVTRVATFMTLTTAATSVPFGADSEILGTVWNMRGTDLVPNTPAGVVTLSYSTDGVTFWPFATQQLGQGGDFDFVLPNLALQKTWWNVVYAGGDAFGPTASTMVVNTYAKLTASSPVRVGTRTYNLSGTLAPGHAAGTRPVRIYLYRKVGRVYKAAGSVLAKASDLADASIDASRYAVKYRFPHAGLWRMRAFHADAGHLATWGSTQTLAVR